MTEKSDTVPIIEFILRGLFNNIILHTTGKASVLIENNSEKITELERTVGFHLIDIGKNWGDDEITFSSLNKLIADFNIWKDEIKLREDDS